MTRASRLSQRGEACRSPGRSIPDILTIVLTIIVKSVCTRPLVHVKGINQWLGSPLLITSLEEKHIVCYQKASVGRSMHKLINLSRHVRRWRGVIHDAYNRSLFRYKIVCKRHFRCTVGRLNVRTCLLIVILLLTLISKVFERFLIVSTALLTAI